MDIVGSPHPWASKSQGSCALPGNTTILYSPKQSVICSPHHDQLWELTEGVCLDSPQMEAGCLLFHGEAPGVLGQSGHSGGVATCCPAKALGLSFSSCALELGSLPLECWLEKPVLPVLDSRVILTPQTTWLPPPRPVCLPTEAIRSERGRKNCFVLCFFVYLNSCKQYFQKEKFMFSLKKLGS